jgi:urea transport system permease protein
MIQSARLIFGNNRAVNAPEFLRGGFEVFPEVVFAYNRLFIVGVTAATVFGMFMLFYRTGLGMRIRAVTQNRNMSACLGIPTRKIDSLAFFIGTGIAGIAGCALTLIGNIVPDMGQNYIVDSFLVVVTGGVGKLAGTVISGFGLGFATKLAEPLLEAVFAKVFILVLVILFLQVRPTGLFPAKGRLED